ncbi:MAG: hypothetical protein ABI905_05535 [Betaproteobacteria bacterium]
MSLSGFTSGTAADFDIALLECNRLYDEGRYDEALQKAELCAGWGEIDFDRRWRGLSALGHVHHAVLHYKAALDAQKEALDLARVHANNLRLAISWNNMGRVFLTACQWDAAVECFSHVAEDDELSAAWSKYQPLGNLAHCYLHLDMLPAAEESVRFALALETPDVVEQEPYSYMMFRLTFVQVALAGNGIWRDETTKRANQVYQCAAKNGGKHHAIIQELVKGNIEFAFGDRAAGLGLLESLRVRAVANPLLMGDVLFSLMQAEKIMGRPERVRSCAREWARYLYPEGAKHAAIKLGIHGVFAPGAFLYDHLQGLGDGDALQALPAWIKNGMKFPK